MDHIEAIAKLKQLDIEDVEASHIEADKILCQLLNYLGYKDVVEEFEKIRKWYA